MFSSFSGDRYLTKLVAGAKERLADDATGPWMTPDGAPFATGSAPGKIALSEADMPRR